MRIYKIAKDTREMLVSFEENLLFEDMQDLKYQIKAGIKPENVWIISYDNEALNDMELIQSIHNRTWGRSTGNIFFYKELFKACSIRAVNYATNAVKLPEELATFILDVSDIEEWWDLIKRNQQIYFQERQVEKEEMLYKDDQRPGEYEESGPDPLRPQY